MTISLNKSSEFAEISRWPVQSPWKFLFSGHSYLEPAGIPTVPLEWDGLLITCCVISWFDILRSFQFLLGEGDTDTYA